jgi:hypothetical protein
MEEDELPLRPLRPAPFTQATEITPFLREHKKNLLSCEQIVYMIRPDIERLSGLWNKEFGDVEHRSSPGG